VLGEISKMGVARSQLGPGIADANYGPTVEMVGGNAATSQPAPVRKAEGAGGKPQLRPPAGLIVF